MKLYSYWRSSASYRVRIGLNLKNVHHTISPVHLVRGGGEQWDTAYTSINPQHQVPALELDDGTVLIQSIAILEYLDEAYPEKPLLPDDPVQRGQCRALGQLVACDIHPLNNLRVLSYLAGKLGADENAKTMWYHHWIRTGLTSMETLLEQAGRGGAFCMGDAPTLADICLVPQLYNARRFELDLTPFPRIRRIEAECLKLAAFAKAAPEAQEDAELAVI